MNTFKKLFEKANTAWIVTKDNHVFAADGTKLPLGDVLKGVKQRRKDYIAFVWDTENDARFILNQAETVAKVKGLTLEQIPV